MEYVYLHETTEVRIFEFHALNQRDGSGRAIYQIEEGETRYNFTKGPSSQSRTVQITPHTQKKLNIRFFGIFLIEDASYLF